MRAARTFLLVLAATILVAAACGNDGSDSAGPQAPDTSDESGADGEAGNLPEPPESAVAVVDGQEISEETFEEQYEQVRSLPAVSEQLQGDQAASAEPILRAQLLSQLVVSDILFRAADDEFDIDISDEQVESRLAKLQEDAGGEEEFARTLEKQGITEELLVEQELPFVLLIEELRSAVAGDDAEQPPPPPTGESQQPTEADRALQEWVTNQLASAEVRVRSEIGTWDPQSGQVRPPGGTGGMGGLQPPSGGQPQPAP